ncbi:MAG TPA: GNAT family N-acetyltransferase [Mycobacteriales bacterium]|nr:GNAT family N-acetyltransferase [Mycobacteriales bacterium]
MRVEEADWRDWRTLRLEALQDTPIGFGETYAEAAVRPDEEWLVPGPRPGIRFIARAGSELLGMAGAFRDEGERPHVFGVFIRPSARGGGVLRALLARLQEWAPGESLVLEVHEDNARARAAYLKLGFSLTGTTGPYNLDPTRLLQEMTLPADTLLG